MRFMKLISALIACMSLISCVFWGVTDNAYIGGLKGFPRPKKVAASSSFLYVPNGDNGIAIIDIREPTRPVLSNTYYAHYGDHNQVVIYGDHAWIAGPTSIEFLDVSDPLAPVVEATEDSVPYTDIYVLDGFLYAIRGSDQLVIMTQGLGPLFSLAPRVLKNVVAAGNYTYISTDTGILILDTSGSPTLIASLDITEDDDTNLIIVGNYAYVSTNKGLVIVDISNRASPVAIETLGLYKNINTMGIRGHDLYLSKSFYDYIPSVIVLDVSSPRSPKYQKTIRFGIGPALMQVVNDNLYAIGEYGLAIIKLP